MKLKHLIIVSLILAILTIGAVSASQDISDDSLCEDSADEEIIASESSEDTVSQGIDEADDDVLSYSDDEAALEAADEPEEALGDYSSGGVHIEINSEIDFSDTYSELGYVSDTHGVKGTITVKIDGKKVFSKKVNYKDDTYYSIETKDLNLKNIDSGYHTVKIIYNDGKAKSDSRKVNFVTIPTVNYPSDIAVGENNGISIEGLAGISGTATLYNRIITGYDQYKSPIYKKGDAIITVNIKNGVGWIPLNTLPVGTHSLQLEYTFGTYEEVKTFAVEVHKNGEGFKSSLSKTRITYGNSITATLTGPKGPGEATIYVDNNYYKYVKFSTGSMKEVISGLTPGKHRITISYKEYDGELFYSKTYEIFVDHSVKLKLPKVTVKKSAKKLVIKATLKLDGKIGKNKKLTFKFNNKKYTAKTDKNGVAKLTIKKSVLKKLKKGKKVKYEVSYGKKTVSKTVKVK
jgi:hypothetical protein